MLRPGLRVPALEALDAATGVHELLLARVEGVALRAELDAQRGDRRAGRELVAAGAVHRALDVVGVDVGLHECVQSRSRASLERPNARRIPGSGLQPPAVGALAISVRNSSLLLVVRSLSISSSRPLPVLEGVQHPAQLPDLLELVAVEEQLLVPGARRSTSIAG